MENVTLQERVNAKFAEIEDMIVAAIQDGAKVEKGIPGNVTIDGLPLYESSVGERGAWGLNKFTHPAIMELFAPDREELQRKADTLRAELANVEQQLAERCAQ